MIGYSFKVDAAEEVNLLSAEERREVCESLTELDVPIETQVALIKKLEAGQVWDCMKEENIEKFNAMEYRFSPENSTKRLVCENGSVLQQSIEFDGSIRAFSAMKTTYNNVKISINNGLSGGGFYASYVIDWNAHNDGILSVKDPYCNVLGGDYSEMSVTINRAYENYSKKKPAEATYTAHISYVGKIGGAETLILKMYVGNDKMVSGKVGTVSISY